MLSRKLFTSHRIIRCPATHRLYAEAMSSTWPAGKSRIILGSSSYSRQGIMKELAQEYGFEYDTATADIDEQSLGDRTSDPAELVTLLAQAKADAIYDRLETKRGLLLTCDQVVIYQGRVREKPASTQQAKEFIHGYSEYPAGTVGCTMCTDLESRQSFKAVDTTWTHFRKIPAEVVDQMVDEGTVMKCAGALMIENPLLTPFITQFQGTKDAIMGLPKSTVFVLVAAAAKAGKNG
ncbi:TPA: hypothetical protein ACH3X1_012121 [Trebouxia sp. C0004]